VCVRVWFSLVSEGTWCWAAGKCRYIRWSS